MKAKIIKRYSRNAKRFATVQLPNLRVVTVCYRKSWNDTDMSAAEIKLRAYEQNNWTDLVESTASRMLKQLNEELES